MSSDAAPGRTVGTCRLLLRPPTLGDVPAVFAILGDAAAMRHATCLPSLRACRRHVAVHEWRRRRDGCAPWLVLERIGPVAGSVIGYGGLFDHPFDPGWGIEVGYWFAPGAWGKGYATELVQASLRVADDGPSLPVVHAFAKPGNLGSRRVLEKCGFAAVGYVAAMQRLLYRRTRGGSGKGA